MQFIPLVPSGYRDPMYIEMDEDPAITTPEQLEWFFERFRKLPAEAQALQAPKIEKYLRRAFMRGDFVFCIELLDKLPHAMIQGIFERKQAALLRRAENQAKSFAVALLEVACRKQSISYPHLLGLFSVASNTGQISCDELMPVVRVLLQSVFFRDGIDFVLSQNDYSFARFMHWLDTEKLLNGDTPSRQKVIFHFFVRGFERVFRWCDAERNRFLLQALEAYFHEPALREVVLMCFQRALEHRDFGQLFLLLRAYSNEPRKKLIASIPHWMYARHPNKSANFLHWLYARQDEDTLTLLRSLIEALPFVQLAWLWAARNESNKRPAQINKQHTAQLKPFLLARLKDEWAQNRSLSLVETDCFVFFQRYGYLNITPRQLVDVVAHSQDPDSRNFVRYYNEIERGCAHVEMYQGVLPRDKRITCANFLQLAILFAEGPADFSEACLLLRKVIVRLQQTIIHSGGRYAAVRTQFCAFKEALHNVALWALENNLLSLEAKDVKYPLIEPFLKKKLSPQHLERLCMLIRGSPSERGKKVLPALEGRLDFWRNFSKFLALRQAQAQITKVHLEEVIRQLQGMRGWELEKANIHLEDLVKLMAQYGDETCRNTRLRYEAIARATVPAASFETEPPSPASILCEAYFIEVTLPRMGIQEDKVLRRGETHLLHSLQYNPITRNVYLLSRYAKSKYFKHGSFKMATGAIEFQAQDRSFFAAKIRLYTTGSKWLGTRTIDTEIVHLRQIELRIMRSLGEHEGFVEFRSIADYVYPRPRLDQRDHNVVKLESRISVIVDPATKVQYPTANWHYPFRERVMICRELCSALDALHRSLGFIHGDFKVSNTMIVPSRRNLPQDLIGAALIDFGFSELCRIGHAIAPLLGNSRYNEGIYGSVLPTAPELLGVRNFQGDHFKVEAFAMGFFMYELQYGKDPVWGNISYAYHKNGEQQGPAQVQAQTQLRNAVNTEVNGLLAPIEKKLRLNIELSPEERYTRIVCALLYPDPARRCTVGQAARELQQLLVLTRPPVLPPAVQASVNEVKAPANAVMATPKPPEDPCVLL